MTPLHGKAALVVGSSRGLGAALVTELLGRGADSVVGIARTDYSSVEHYAALAANGTYRHLQLDIGNQNCLETLKNVTSWLPPEPLLLFFNAACLDQDLLPDLTINHTAFAEVNRVGVIGFGHTICAFQEHLLRYGGILIGISSINALRPPVLQPSLAYGATKAYMSMALRSLALVWPQDVKIVTFHLGHIGGKEGRNLPFGLSPPSYEETAKMIVRTISRPKFPSEVTYPLIYRVAYRHAFSRGSDRTYHKILLTCLKYFASR